jgi:hypothetical protein
MKVSNIGSAEDERLLQMLSPVLYIQSRENILSHPQVCYDYSNKTS